MHLCCFVYVCMCVAPLLPKLLGEESLHATVFLFFVYVYMCVVPLLPYGMSWFMFLPYASVKSYLEKLQIYIYIVGFCP